jgi:hypothetical protein
MGMASTYDIGTEGMEGIIPSVGRRGTPGFEGYPGVVLKIVRKFRGDIQVTYGSPGATLRNCALPL